MAATLDELRRLAVAQSLFPPTTLKRAIEKMGFIQADPIRAPARAQDLILRHRVKNYQVGDLDRNYAKLGVEEDSFINYGFVTRALQALMHPRSDVGVPAYGYRPWPAARKKKAELLLEFIRERGMVHPREVDQRFSHGKVENYWGGSSNATTHLLNAMHYRGLVRVARREAGIRIYAAHQHDGSPIDAAERRARIDAMVDIAARIYAPMPASSLRFLIRRLRIAVPQWQGELKGALDRARQRYSHARVEDVDWCWPPDTQHSATAPPEDIVRLLAPFDPVVWNRPRFQLLWGWEYRFEAYTPAPKRKLGYYALPLLWRDRVIGWGNIAVKDGELQSEVGYVASPPRDRSFKSELEAELDRMRTFLRL